MRAGSRPLAIDLFAGAGGMTLGFEQAGFDVPASVELDPVHCCVHEFNFPHWKVLCTDVRTIGGDRVRTDSGIGDRDIDVVFGGPPCQGFSLIGHRALDDPRNALMQHFVRLVLELEPKYFVMENVSGLTVGPHKRFLLEVIEEFQAHGYGVQRPYRVLNAANYGVPQDRRRLFLFGARRGLALPMYPAQETSLRNGSNGQLLFPEPPTVWEALSDLPSPDGYPELLERDWVYAKFGEPAPYARALRGLECPSNDLSYPRIWDSSLLTSSLRTEHTSISIERFTATGQGRVEPISRFLKLDPNGVCNTLRAGTPSNRGAFTSPRPIHPSEPRCITVREAARLHSYPDWFRFHVTKWHGFRQVGNSVPPRLARAVAGEIARALGAQPEKPGSAVSLGARSLLEANMSEAALRFGVDRHVIEPRTRTERAINA